MFEAAAAIAWKKETITYYLQEKNGYWRNLRFALSFFPIHLTVPFTVLPWSTIPAFCQFTECWNGIFRKILERDQSDEVVVKIDRLAASLEKSGLKRAEQELLIKENMIW